MCADVFNKAKRSELMSRIKGGGNRSTEQRFASLLRGARISGWRRGSRLTGKPDFVFPKLKLAIFVDGCFWHGCRKCRSIPTSNRKFWHAKLSRNRTRDAAVNRTLRRAGWRVIRVWEHDLRTPEKTFARIHSILTGV